ncbi:hypothetical protein BO71DRAFT_412168 [Aspergillus ellipticus CBS 707.79]|uniref:beta-glucosidase n=1 Tax=Aspergillus ellipticus CBS 707.79 TaxID=1448320 RepID=A0A319DSB8_9EURO|nr:hypothetical protein BO71DRAFT_412168 [Aspergillus ellipticus CBS 707.79]
MASPEIEALLRKLTREEKIEWFNGSTIGETLVHRERKPLPEYMIQEQWPSYLTAEYCTRPTCTIRPTTTGEHILSVISTGSATVSINGTNVFTRPQETNLRPESFHFVKSQLERRFTHPMTAGQPYTLVLESWKHRPRHPARQTPLRPHVPGLLVALPRTHRHPRADPHRVPNRPGIRPRRRLRRDNKRDRIRGLRPRQHGPLAAAHNPNPIVVNFSGGPVGMTQFVSRVPAIIQAWFPGQECGHSLARVPNGSVNRSGRLPFSWPKGDEDSPILRKLSLR